MKLKPENECWKQFIVSCFYDISIGFRLADNMRTNRLAWKTMLAAPAVGSLAN